MDANDVTIPLGLAFGCMSMLAGSLIWMFNIFERKDDAKSKHDRLEQTVRDQGDSIHYISKSVHTIAQDVSYIRGKLERE